VLDENGPRSETLGILGRVYRDRWVRALAKGEVILATGFLDRAIDTYLRGFEADLRDSYPGINALLLLRIKGDDISMGVLSQYLPVVKFAVTQRMKTAKPDYWDYSTLLILAILENDENAAHKHLAEALAAVRERWEPLSTAASLELLERKWRDGSRADLGVAGGNGSSPDPAMLGFVETARHALVARGESNGE
jgi:hypothetical protein